MMDQSVNAANFSRNITRACVRGMQHLKNEKAPFARYCAPPLRSHNNVATIINVNFEGGEMKRVPPKCAYIFMGVSFEVEISRLRMVCDYSTYTITHTHTPDENYLIPTFAFISLEPLRRDCRHRRAEVPKWRRLGHGFSSQNENHSHWQWQNVLKSSRRAGADGEPTSISDGMRGVYCLRAFLLIYLHNLLR